jgi:hypothetical protein
MAISEYTKSGPTMKDVLEPGFHSDEPSTWKSHRAAERKAAALASGYLTMNMKKSVDAKFKTSFPPPGDWTRDDFVEALNHCILTSRGRFELMEPKSLTIVKKTGQYAKRPHIGGEEFALVSCYIGKKDQPVFVFEPVAASDYKSVEMGLQEASALLGEFDGFMASSGIRPILAARAAAHVEVQSKKENDERLARPEYQALGYGSW